ncbi:methionyl-tRNA formyltransferase [Candidatus Berkelbacteria bacterium]|nr:methionyl-tRNA formyltransferase [Candidatus Berkelbacteria bacterium]
MNQKTLSKCVFFGTPEFALPSLMVLKENFQLLAVVTEPDKPMGREKKIVFSPVKNFVLKHKIPLKQPETKEEIAPILKKLKPDFGVVASYGKILPKEALEAPAKGFINVHASLLPKYRGASPIQYAILNGEKETGITLILMDEEVDHGPVLAQAKTPIFTNDTTALLVNRLADLGASLLIQTLPDYIKGKIKPKKQKHTQATFVSKLKKEDGEIEWSKGAAYLERQIRAFSPWPGSYITILGKRVILFSARLTEKNLVIDEIQIEGKNKMKGKDFQNGFKKYLTFFPSFVKF